MVYMYVCRGVWVDVSLYDNNINTDMCRTGVHISIGHGNRGTNIPFLVAMRYAPPSEGINACSAVLICVT